MGRHLRLEPILMRSGCKSKNPFMLNGERTQIQEGTAQPHRWGPKLKGHHRLRCTNYPSTPADGRDCDKGHSLVQQLVKDPRPPCGTPTEIKHKRCL